VLLANTYTGTQILVYSEATGSFVVSDIEGIVEDVMVYNPVLSEQNGMPTFVILQPSNLLYLLYDSSTNTFISRPGTSLGGNLYMEVFGASPDGDYVYALVCTNYSFTQFRTLRSF